MQDFFKYIIHFPKSSGYYSLYHTFAQPIFLVFVIFFFNLGLLLSTNIFYYLVCILAGWISIGIIIYKITFSVHDCAHSSLWQDESLNRFAGRINCIFLLISFEKYRILHLIHHSSKKKEEDPDKENYWPDFLNETKESSISIPYSQINKLKLWLISPIFFSRFFKIFNSLFLKKEIIKNVNPKFKKRLKLITKNKFISFLPFINFIFLSLIFYTIINFSNVFISNSSLINFLVILITYFISATTISLTLGRWRTFTEHVDILFNDEKKLINLRYHSSGINTINSFVSNLFFHNANFNFHSIHHLYPRMQSYKFSIYKYKKTYQNIEVIQKYDFKKSTFNLIKEIFTK